MKVFVELCILDQQILTLCIPDILISIIAKTFFFILGEN